MFRGNLVRVFALVLCMAFVTALIAADGVVVSSEKGKVTVKVGDKEQVIELKGVKVSDAEGKAVKGKDVGDVLKKDAKVEVVEKDGKVAEIKIKK
jgi:hypothetical protein